jgi:D-sedoheptulose 7-phosphate isomerase
MAFGRAGVENMVSFYAAFFDEVKARLADASAEELEALCDVLRATRAGNRKVLLAGNGASAAIASHVSVDLTKTAGVRAVCFNESNLITCYANDYGYEHWVAKAIDSYCDAGDVAVLISSSGKSPNMVNAAHRARERGLTVITLSGFQPDNPLRASGHQNLWVNSRSYNQVEIAHQTWLLACIDRLATELA